MGKGECQMCFGKKRKNSAFLPNTAQKKWQKVPKITVSLSTGFLSFQ